MAKESNPGREDGAGASTSPQQTQDSRQSTQNPSRSQHGSGSGKTPQSGSSETDSKRGLGSSQAQDREGPTEGDAGSGTPDIERSDRADDDSGTRESLVHDPTGAFKERP